jgi:hypothetical protein
LPSFLLFLFFREFFFCIFLAGSKLICIFALRNDKKGDTIMNDKKKMYEKPSMRVVKLQTCRMLADSLFGATSVNGNVFQSQNWGGTITGNDR